MDEKKTEKEELFIETLYDLVLNNHLSEEERCIICHYKNEIEDGKDLEVELYHLARNLEKMAIRKNKVGQMLCSEVQDFYKEICNKYLLKKNLGYGLIAMGGIFHI